MIEAQSQNDPLISVVIPTWNAASFVERVLTSFQSQSDPNFEVLVIDNGKINTETEAVVAKFQDRKWKVRYFGYVELLGYAGAVNEGTRLAASDVVAVFNNDNIADPDWLLQLRRAYFQSKKQGVEAIVTSLVDRHDFLQPLRHRTNFWFRLASPPGFLQTARQVFHPDGSAFLFHRGFFGLPYDRDYFVYQEDVALGWRAWLWGAEVHLIPLSKAVTFDGGSTRRIKHRTAFYTERNRLWNYLIYLSLGSFIKAVPILGFDFAVRLIFGRNCLAKLMALLTVSVQLPLILRKRKAIQVRRKRYDDKILPLLSSQYLTRNQGGGIWINEIFSFLIRILALPLGK